MYIKKSLFFPFVMLTFLIFLASCTYQRVPTGSFVDYGASLDEWEEAAKNEAETASEEINLAPTLPVPEVASPVPVTTSVPITTSTASDFVLPEAEQNQSNASGVNAYREIGWENLVPMGFSPQEIASKYQDELAQFQDGDPAALEVYEQMQEEFNNAPINDELDGAMIKIPGFIAPLEYDGDEITEFLLVPYFGACIHVPAPPTNQTVYVKTAEGEGIAGRDAYNPVWVFGIMQTENKETELAQAGYVIEDAVIELYSYEN